MEIAFFQSAPGSYHWDWYHVHIESCRLIPYRTMDLNTDYTL